METLRISSIRERKNEKVICSSCGDEYLAHIGLCLTKDKCPECFGEINYGIIPERITDSAGGIGSPDDTSPSWENAVRVYEERE